MPPLSFSVAAPSQTLKPSKMESNIIAVDVGGQIFQTTKQTLTQSGPNSILSALPDSPEPFLDRDPELFSILLSLLRTGNLPSKAKAFDLQDLIEESSFYGIESILTNAVSNPSQFDAFSLEKSRLVDLNGRNAPSAVAASPCGSLHVAHGSKVTYFDWSLRRKSTMLTQFAAVDSLRAISATTVAAGATDFSGLQILDVGNRAVRATLTWDNSTRSSSTVQAIGSSADHLFASFESGRRNSNTIMVYDLQSLLPAAEIAHSEIYGSDLDSALPATKLQWSDHYNLLMACGSHSGPSGVTGNIKLWDLRSGTAVWEAKEKTDCFADVTISDHFGSIFKVGINSGEVFTLDMRTLRPENPWVCLGDGRKAANVKKEGFGCRIESHGSQVFCSKGGDMEMWSEVAMSGSSRVFRKNLLGRNKDIGGARVSNLVFGGNKMFVTRKEMQCVEVWQSCSSIRVF